MSQDAVKAADTLKGAEAFLFDVFGTVVDWLGSVSRELQEKHYDGILQFDWIEFAKEWRQGYADNTVRIAKGGEGTKNVDEMHRQLLDAMLASPKWETLGKLWDEKKRDEINFVWHRLYGWQDSSPGLYELKKHAVIGTLSNGNVRLLINMAKHADLPWDVIFSGELLGSYKPNPVVYDSALKHLSLAATPDKCVLVAAHIYDLRAAAARGYRTVYIRRSTEDNEHRDKVKPKSEGGEVDLVVDNIEELATVVKWAKEA